MPPLIFSTEQRQQQSRSSAHFVFEFDSFGLCARVSPFVPSLESCSLILLLLSSSSIRFIRNRFSISLFVHLRLSHNYWLSFCDYVIKHTQNSLFSLFCVGLWPVFLLARPMFSLRDGSKIPTHTHIHTIALRHPKAHAHALNERKYWLTLHHSIFYGREVRPFLLSSALCLSHSLIFRAKNFRTSPFCSYLIHVRSCLTRPT